MSNHKLLQNLAGLIIYYQVLSVCFYYIIHLAEKVFNPRINYSLGLYFSDPFLIYLSKDVMYLF